MSLAQMLKKASSDLLVTPKHEEFLRSNSNVELDEQVAEFVRNELVAKQRYRGRSFSASSLGSCTRKQVFTYLDAKQERKPDSGAASIFIHGTWTHLKWQAMGFMAGWLGMAEVPVTIDSHNMKGTIDGILTTGEGWELKSINARGYRAVIEFGPKPEHLKQIHGYMLATGIRVWSLIYEEKDTQVYKEFTVYYDPEIATQVMQELEMLNSAVADKTLPPMLATCIEKNGMTYRSCPYRDQCRSATWPRRITITKNSPSSTSTSTVASTA
jgi:hypothetical protein